MTKEDLEVIISCSDASTILTDNDWSETYSVPLTMTVKELRDLHKTLPTNDSLLNSNKHEPQVKQLLADYLDRDLFIKNAGTWMDVDTFCDTVMERDKIKICKNCKHWNKTTKCCEEEDLFGSIELNQSPLRDGTFGCNRFDSKQSV